MSTGAPGRQPQDASAACATLASACRRLAACGLVPGSAGNLSARIGDTIAVTPTGAELERLDPDDVTLVSTTGEVIEGRLAPTSELDLHLAVYSGFGSAVGAVVHTHAPYATALACVLDELPCVHYAMLDLGGAVRVAPYRTFGTRALADVTVEALRDRSAALMSNHGTIAFGKDVTQAVRRTELLEWACTLYMRAAMLGTPRALDEGQLEEVARAIRERGYGATQTL